MSTIAFDTLAYAKSLESSGVAREHAEAHALAVRDHVMKDIATKADIQAALDKQTLKMTVRLGSMVTVATGLIVAAFALF